MFAPEQEAGEGAGSAEGASSSASATGGPVSARPTGSPRGVSVTRAEGAGATTSLRQSSSGGEPWAASGRHERATSVVAGRTGRTQAQGPCSVASAAASVAVWSAAFASPLLASS